MPQKMTEQDWNEAAKAFKKATQSWGKYPASDSIEIEAIREWCEHQKIPFDNNSFIGNVAIDWKQVNSHKKSIEIRREKRKKLDAFDLNKVNKIAYKDRNISIDIYSASVSEMFLFLEHFYAHNPTKFDLLSLESFPYKAAMREIMEELEARTAEAPTKIHATKLVDYLLDMNSTTVNFTSFSNTKRRPGDFCALWGVPVEFDAIEFTYVV